MTVLLYGKVNQMVENWKYLSNYLPNIFFINQSETLDKKIKMINKELAITAYLGLKLKYPGLEIDKTGILCAEFWEIFLPFVFRSSGGWLG